ncbi:toprim domain-containing protein [Gelidibacter mesophilus]|uniref:toprim domain-containing protein n=1 Tax=Gelidibacter mesophilus TaxID=169050 RepID=UPI00041A62A0|nr:toprim domain-containing protein [Gelidibacter mesophilus]
MNFKEAKNIDIISYLKKLGLEPEKNYGKYSMFSSPFRNEKTASLKVDRVKNLWVDYGTNEGGSIIDLIMHLNNCSPKEALNILSINTFSFHRKEETPKANKSTYSILKITDLKNRNLLAYLDERKINLDFARQFFHQIHYTFDNKKEYYGIGFRNDLEGFEIRNKFFKGCLGKKSITTFLNQSNTVSLFESGWDALAYLTLKNKIPKEDFIILNSTALVKNTLALVQNYSKIKVLFDNDVSGKTALKYIEDNTKNEVIDCSVHYSEHNDLNDYLISQQK